MTHRIELPDDLCQLLRNMANETEHDLDSLIVCLLEGAIKEEGFLLPSSPERERVLMTTLSLPAWTRPVVSEDKDKWFLVALSPVQGSDVRVGVRISTWCTDGKCFFVAVMEDLSAGHEVVFCTEVYAESQEICKVGRLAISGAMAEMVLLLRAEKVNAALLRDRSDWGWT